MAHCEISIGRSYRSGLYVSAHLINGDVVTRLTKEKLYRFLSIHIPSFSRYSCALTRYTFHELCQFLIDQDKYTFLHFGVSVHPCKLLHI